MLAAKIAPDGDRDGLPNVLVEAQSQRLACISTDAVRHSGADRARRHRLARAARRPRRRWPARWSRLIGDPALRARLGAAGEARVRAVIRHARRHRSACRRCSDCRRQPSAAGAATRPNRSPRRCASPSTRRSSRPIMSRRRATAGSPACSSRRCGWPGTSPFIASRLRSFDPRPATRAAGADGARAASAIAER